MKKEGNMQLNAIELPHWIDDVVTLGQKVPCEEERMAISIELSKRQVEQQTGGPFGAIVCALESGEVLGIGVNQVTASGWSSAHAEFIAWTMAQQCRHTYDLGIPAVGLYSSAQPCVSCWGGLFWTGISKLVYGATKRDVERYAGFDEGPLPSNWQEMLEQKGIVVEGGVLQSAAIKPLQEYLRLGGECYNAKSP